MPPALGVWLCCAILCLLEEAQAITPIFTSTISSASCKGTTTVSGASTPSPPISNCDLWVGDIIVDLAPTNASSFVKGPVLSTPTPATPAVIFRLPAVIQGTIEFRNGNLSKLDPMEEPLNYFTATCFSFDNVTFADNTANFVPNPPGPIPGIPSVNFTDTNIAQIYGDGENVLLSGGNVTQTRLNITATGNSNLTIVQFAGLSNILTNVDIRQNNPKLTLNFTDLRNGTMRVANVTTLNAPLLETVYANQLGFLDTPQYFSGNSFTGLNFSNLTTMQSVVQIEDNLYLDNVNLSRLQYAVGLQVFNNPNLKHLDLPALTNVSTLDILGPMELQLPQLKMTSTQSLSDITLNDKEMLNCTTDTVSSPSLICQVQSASTASNATSTPGSSDSGNAVASNSGLSKGAKIGIGVGVGLGLAILLLAGALFLLSRLKRKRRGQAESTRGEYSKADLDAGPGSSPVSMQRESKNPMQVRDAGIAAGEEVEDSRQRPVSALLGDEAHGGRTSYHAPAELEEQQGERYEMEEQQGVRHEMDARSLHDIELGDDGDGDARSLDDIERTHGKD